MKTQKLVRKYRFLKPNEVPQLGDWFNYAANGDGIETISFPKRGEFSFLGGWAQIDNEFEWTLLHINNPTRSYIYARFVDCVPSSTP